MQHHTSLVTVVFGSRWMSQRRSNPFDFDSTFAATLDGVVGQDEIHDVQSISFGFSYEITPPSVRCRNLLRRFYLRDKRKGVGGRVPFDAQAIDQNIDRHVVHDALVFDTGDPFVFSFAVHRQLNIDDLNT